MGHRIANKDMFLVLFFSATCWARGFWALSTVHIHFTLIRHPVPFLKKIIHLEGFGEQAEHTVGQGSVLL